MPPNLPRLLDDPAPLVACTYDLSDLSWERIAGRFEQVAIAVLRLDARLEASGLSAGWQSRGDLAEAVCALILDGQLVDVGDLVLHDAGMDVRHLTRAATALRSIPPVRGEGTSAPSTSPIPMTRQPTRPLPTMPIPGRRICRDH